MLFLLGVFLVAGPWYSIPRSTGALPQGFQDNLVTNILGTPMDIAWTPDGRLLIVTRDGTLRVFANGALLPNPAIDLSPVVCTLGDEALGGVAVHPNFTLNHYIYLYYTYKKFGTCNINSPDDPVNRLSRFYLPENNSASPASEVVLLDTPPLPSYDHMGDDLQFGRDGLLYLTIGDGGSACCSSTPRAPEDPGVLLGKVVRLTDSGGIPPGNPFTGSDSARCNLNGVPPTGSPLGTKCQEVFAMGLRNPFRAAFDPNNSSIRYFVNDVGENTWEEVNLGAAGADYGWPTREGPCAAANPLTDCGPPPPGLTNPIFWYAHNETINSTVCSAITAGAFIPNGLWPGFNNSYLYADWVCGGVWQLTSDSKGGFTRTLFATVAPSGITSMRFGPNGNTQALYYVTLAAGGQLRRISSTNSADVRKLANNFLLDWSDYDNNGRINVLDIAQAAICFDKTPNSTEWSQCAYWDLSQNHVIDITDIAHVALEFNKTMTAPFPGSGQPPGVMDPSWKNECALLARPEQDYCFTLP